VKFPAIKGGRPPTTRAHARSRLKPHFAQQPYGPNGIRQFYAISGALVHYYIVWFCQNCPFFNCRILGALVILRFKGQAERSNPALLLAICRIIMKAGAKQRRPAPAHPCLENTELPGGRQRGVRAASSAVSVVVRGCAIAGVRGSTALSWSSSRGTGFESISLQQPSVSHVNPELIGESPALWRRARVAGGVRKDAQAATGDPSPFSMTGIDAVPHPES